MLGEDIQLTIGNFWEIFPNGGGDQQRLKKFREGGGGTKKEIFSNIKFDMKNLG